MGPPPGWPAMTSPAGQPALSHPAPGSPAAPVCRTCCGCRGSGGSCMSRSFYFTSESVTEGHPDKLADQISDAVLDALLEQDPSSRVACETFLTTGTVFVAGEITTSGYVEIPDIARRT